MIKVFAFHKSEHQCEVSHTQNHKGTFRIFSAISTLQQKNEKFDKIKNTGYQRQVVKTQFTPHFYSLLMNESS